MKTWKNNSINDYKTNGEWVNEPDKAHWVDEKTHLDCLIVRNFGGSLCCYVGVPASNQHFKKECDDVEASVHGGLTFADFCMDTKDESIGVCHPKELAANDNVWWLGFDCAHSGDICPKYVNHLNNYSSYKNFEYVKNQVTKLAKQLSA